MSELDNLVNKSKFQQEKSGVQEDEHSVLRTLSKIVYYFGIVLLIISGISFVFLLSEGKDYIGGIFIGCLVGGINSLFFGLVGKCLIDIYNKVSKDK